MNINTAHTEHCTRHLSFSLLPCALYAVSWHIYTLTTHWHMLYLHCGHFILGVFWFRNGEYSRLCNNRPINDAAANEYIQVSVGKEGIVSCYVDSRLLFCIQGCVWGWRMRIQMRMRMDVCMGNDRWEDQAMMWMDEWGREGAEKLTSHYIITIHVLRQCDQSRWEFARSTG